MNTPAYYTSSFTNTVVNACYKTGLFPSVLLGLALVETNAGNTELAKQYHNHFSIKPTAKWIGLTVDQKQKDGETGTFCFYNDPKESFHDFVKAAREDEDMKRAGVFRAKKVETQLQKVAEALGESEEWAATILKVVKDNELEKVDEQAKETWNTWNKK